MVILPLVGLVILVGLGGLVVLGWQAKAQDNADRRAVWDRLEHLRALDPARYDPAMVAGLPEVARRYFSRAIAPGTALHRVVRLEMAGRFVLNGKTLPMTAHQILAPPEQGFVWQANIGKGLLSFAGSDGYDGNKGESWTKFWLAGLLPLARMGGTRDHARAAAMRAALESVWVPAALLPQVGADWVQTGPDSAEIRFAATPDLPPIHLTLDPAGDPTEVWALRWSDANSEKTYRLQPFGGKILATGSFDGFRVPVEVEMGNHFGTANYAPFFLASVSYAAY